MYVSLGKDTVIPAESIIGIFDLDITSQSYLTRNFLNASEKSGKVFNASEDIPKSFVVCSDNPDKKDSRIYLCQAAPATLNKRIENKII